MTSSSSTLSRPDLARPDTLRWEGRTPAERLELPTSRGLSRPSRVSVGDGGGGGTACVALDTPRPNVLSRDVKDDGGETGVLGPDELALRSDGAGECTGSWNGGIWACEQACRESRDERAPKLSALRWSVSCCWGRSAQGPAARERKRRLTSHVGLDSQRGWARSGRRGEAAEAAGRRSQRRDRKLFVLRRTRASGRSLEVLFTGALQRGGVDGRLGPSGV